jgi:hypothetical protein
MKKGDKVVLVFKERYITNIAIVTEVTVDLIKTTHGDFYKVNNLSVYTSLKRIEVLTPVRQELFEVGELVPEIEMYMQEFLRYLKSKSKLVQVLPELRILLKLLKTIRGGVK